MIRKLIDALPAGSQIRTAAAAIAASWGIDTLQAELADVRDTYAELNELLVARQADLVILEDTISAQRARLAELDGEILARCEPNVVEPLQARTGDGRVTRAFEADESDETYRPGLPDVEVTPDA